MLSSLFQVADIFLAYKYAAYAISGPTVQGGLPAFNWNRFNKTLHAGMPEVYDFDFVTMKPILTQWRMEEEKDAVNTTPKALYLALFSHLYI